MAEKFCIFCGKKPQNKNMEHVIPQWLIKLTEREKKDVFDGTPANHKHINFMQFKFPACEVCNSKYSELEAQTKPILETVLSGGTLTGTDLNILLDWFDKIRIGLWLVEMYYDKNLRTTINPHFFIDTRMGLKDRFLCIKKLDIPADKKGILWGGTESFLFKSTPSAFVMLINDYLFYNASDDNLISPHVGFPVMNFVKTVDSTKSIFEAKLQAGKNKIVQPILPGFINKDNMLCFYQPMFKQMAGNTNYVNNPYVQQHCYDMNNGIGGIFCQKGKSGEIRYLTQSDKIGIKVKPSEKIDLATEALNLQSIVYKKTPQKTPLCDIVAFKDKQMLDFLTKTR